MRKDIVDFERISINHKAERSSDERPVKFKKETMKEIEFLENFNQQLKGYACGGHKRLHQMIKNRIRKLRMEKKE